PGVIIDSVDTAAVWRHIPRLYEEVRGVILDQAESVGCTLSDAGEWGAALEFSFVIRATDDDEAERSYLALWPEALVACTRPGGYHAAVGHNYADRLARAGRETRRAGLDALIITPSADLLYLTGYDTLLLPRLTALVARPGGEPVLLVPELERPRAAASPASQ